MTVRAPTATHFGRGGCLWSGRIALARHPSNQTGKPHSARESGLSRGLCMAHAPDESGCLGQAAMVLRTPTCDRGASVTPGHELMCNWQTSSDFGCPENHDVVGDSRLVCGGCDQRPGIFVPFTAPPPPRRREAGAGRESPPRTCVRRFAPSTFSSPRKLRGNRRSPRPIAALHLRRGCGEVP
jgi:hypothetical protein